jgi:phosphoglycolate phosphatase-like HAD superfamily hydrolase
VFFDIDGTLLETAGAGRSALSTALLRVFGTTGTLDGYHFHGRTDPQIVLDLMTSAGLPVEEVRARLPAVWPVYLAELERELETRRDSGRVRPLPGVVELLAALEARGGVALGLLTGNIEEGARVKLAAAGLRTAFDLGGYGSDSAERIEIARIAARRSHGSRGSEHVVVVGDTPADVACARAIGARALAVATGRHGLSDLADAGADAVLPDLSDTAGVVALLLSLSRRTAMADSGHIDGMR